MAAIGLPHPGEQAATSVLRSYPVVTGTLLHTWSTRDQSVVGGSTQGVTGNTALRWVDGDRALSFATSSSV
jgi:hypothetical protein